MLRSIMLLGIGIALVASACSSDVSDGTASASPVSADYLAEVSEVEGAYAAGFDSIFRATTESYAI